MGSMEPPQERPPIGEHESGPARRPEIQHARSSKRPTEPDSQTSAVPSTSEATRPAPLVDIKALETRRPGERTGEMDLDRPDLQRGQGLSRM